MAITDDDVWVLFKKGDKQAFKLLFKRYYKGLCVLSERYVKSPIIAEDIVQDVFYTLLKKRETITIPRSTKAFLGRSVINNSLNYLKKYNKEDISEIFPEQETGIEPEDIVLNDELYHVIKQGISSLPEQCGKVFKLNRFEGLKHKEIADKLNISVKTVKNHIGKALRIIRTNVESYQTGSGSISNT